MNNFIHVWDSKPFSYVFEDFHPKKQETGTDHVMIETPSTPTNKNNCESGFFETKKIS
jgi:hypothetical protein